MGHIRRNVNWTAKITRGETGTTGFSIVGRKNPILVHVGKTDSGRDATVRFKQCETEFGEEGPKWDDCEITQNASRKFVLRYLDYNEVTHERSDGAEVKFSDDEGKTLSVATINNGEAEYVDRTGTLVSVHAEITRTREYPDYLGLEVTDTEVYQVGKLEDGVRSGETNANYLQTVSAWTKYNIEYDNNSGVDITTSATLYMLQKFETKVPKKYENVGENITTNGKEIKFTRNGVDETLKETVFADSSVVVCGENDDQETVVFKAPNRVIVKYNTDYKRYDNPEDGISGVTSTMFNPESFTTDLYDPEVFTYVAKAKTPVDHEITLDYRYNGKKFSTETIEIKAPKDNGGNIIDWKSYSAITGIHEIVAVYNDDIDFTDKLDAVTHVTNEDKVRFNSYSFLGASYGGSTQIRMSNDANAEWAQATYGDKGIGTFLKRCNPGMLRKTNCPENSLKLFSCKIDSNTSTTATNFSTSTDHKWSDMYFTSNNSDSPANKYSPNDYSTALIIPSTGVADFKIYTYRGNTPFQTVFKDVNSEEIARTKLYNSVMDSSKWPSLQNDYYNAIDYPQFGYMMERDSKYILFGSEDLRNIVIVSRDSGASENDSIEEVVSNSITYPEGVETLSSIVGNVLFTVSGDELIPNDSVWADCGDELEQCKNMIISVYKKNSENGIFKLNQNNQIIGFIYKFGLGEHEFNTTVATKNPNPSQQEIKEYLIQARFIDSISHTSSSWHAKEDDPVQTSEIVKIYKINGDTDITQEDEWVDVEPMLFKEDDIISGLSCVLNIEDDVRPEEKLRAAYQLPKDNGLIRTSRASYKRKWDIIKVWKAINLNVDENNSNNIRSLRVSLINKDKYHYDKTDFIKALQPLYDTPSYYPYYNNGDNVRFDTRLDIIQLGTGTTEEELSNFVCENKTSFLYNFPSTFYGVYPTKDKKIEGPKQFDFSNYYSDQLPERLTFELQSGGPLKISFKRYDSKVSGKLEFAYSQRYDTGITWFDMSNVANTAATLDNTNTYVTFRGTLSPSGETGIGTFSISGDGTCSISGSVMSLLYTPERFNTNFGGEENYVFKDLFSGCTALTDASDLYLPSASVIEGCYQGMFKGCTSLVKPPMLQAWGSADNCYDGMYSGCTSLNEIYVMTKDDPTTSTGIWNGISASGGTVTRNSKSTWTTIPVEMIENEWTVVAENSGRT